MKFHRNNSSYRMLVGVCQLIVKGLLIKNESGQEKLASWLQGEEMYQLYEKFVLSYYLRHHPEFKPRSAHIEWDLAGEVVGYLPRMISDIMLESGDRTLIIDTKYYQKTMHVNSLHDSRKYISNNLYQIYAYVKNRDRHGTGNVAGVLLYAKTDEEDTPNHDYVIGGNRICLKTLDLNQDWKEIVEQLEALCVWLEKTN